MDTPRAVIDMMGGTAKLADRLHVTLSAVSNWLKDGIPKSRIPDLLQIAKDDGLPGVTLEALMPLSAGAHSDWTSRAARDSEQSGRAARPEKAEAA